MDRGMKMLSSPDIQAILVSLQAASLGTILGLPLAIGIAWVLVRSTFKGKAVLDILVSFPLVLPPVVTGYVMLIVLGRQGPIGSLLYQTLGINLVFTWVAAGLACCIVSLPLMVRAMEVAISGIDPKMELAARSLGAGPIKAFASITLPLAYRGIISAALIAFARGLGEFGATMIVAGNIPGKTQTLPLAIFTNLQTGDDGNAIRLIAFSLALASISLITHHMLLKRRGFRNQ